MDENDSMWITFFFSLLSHIALFPTILFLYKRKMYYEVCVSSFSATTSLMYHSTECFNKAIFLTSMRWHRLDNIGAISSLTITCLHLCCFESDVLADIFKYIFLFFTIILQEANPWDINYTAIPIVLAALMVPISHYLHSRRRRLLVRKNLIFGIIALSIGILFFIRGLDDENDPFRMFHSLFHVCVGVGLYHIFHSMKQRGKIPYVEKTDSAVLTFDV